MLAFRNNMSLLLIRGLFIVYCYRCWWCCSASHVMGLLDGVYIGRLRGQAEAEADFHTVLLFLIVSPRKHQPPVPELGCDGSLLS